MKLDKTFLKWKKRFSYHWEEYFQWSSCFQMEVLLDCCCCYCCSYHYCWEPNLCLSSCCCCCLHQNRRIPSHSKSKNAFLFIFAQGFICLFKNIAFSKMNDLKLQKLKKRSPECRPKSWCTFPPQLPRMRRFQQIQLAESISKQFCKEKDRCIVPQVLFAH